MTMGIYNLTFTNNSSLESKVCLYMEYKQQLLDTSVHKIAWFVRPCRQKGGAHFTWDLQYEVQYSKTKALGPGVPFEREGGIRLDPKDTTQNSVDLFKQEDLTYAFKHNNEKPGSGNVKVCVDRSVQNKALAVGVAIADHVALAVDAKMNTTRTFYLNPQDLFMYIVVGNMNEGCVVNHNDMITKSQRINFPNLTYNAAVILRSNNLWGVEYD